MNGVVLSGYSQRPCKATGQLVDEYLYSVKVLRDEWTRLQFGNLTSIETPVCLEQFQLKRNMSKTGNFTAIEPFAKTAHV